MAAPHSIAAARMLTRNLREHGKMQLMMYSRPSANYHFPSSRTDRRQSAAFSGLETVVVI
jgi:carbamoylphosphate synthase small subunit